MLLAHVRNGPNPEPQYANLDLASIILVTLPQPIRAQPIRTGAVALGNLDVRHEPTLVL
jgi:hypothetical protein